MMRKAEITAFLSMVFVLLVSFVLGMLEVSVIQTSKSMSRLTVDRAVFSVFGGYQSELFEDYHVFALDGSYGSGTFSKDQLTGRLHYYGDPGISHEITGIQYLTDNGGQAFREQVLEYMESKYGISLVRRFTGLTQEWKEEVIRGEQMEQEEADLAADIQALKGDSEDQILQEAGGDPFTCLEVLDKSGVLSLVMPEEMTLSGREIRQGEQASARPLRTGFGSLPQRQGTDGLEEKLLFNEYVLKNFTNAALKSSTDAGADEEAPVRSLAYEAEYILEGKASDKENLEAVLLKIFFIRMALNYLYLMSDTGKQGEVTALATVIATVLLIPEAAEVISQLILLAWAAGESTVDLRTLLSGRRAPVLKSAENWQLPLSSLLTLGSSAQRLSGNDTEGGISYEDYLRMFLFLGNTDDITMRTLDRIEENLAMERALDHIRADQCITKLELQNETAIAGGITYTFPAYFGYQ